MNVSKIGQMNIPKCYALTRIGFLMLIILFAWLGTGTKEATANESDYEYLAFGDGVEITNYVGTAKEITIPDTLGGRPVVSIGNSAFSNKQLISVVIPDSVTSLGYLSFSYNQLKGVVIPDRVTSIGERAFKSNELTSVVIPDRVTRIGERAFEYNKLASVVIPDSVTSIGERAFQYNELTSVVIPDSVTSIGYSAFWSNPDVIIIGEEGSTAEEFALAKGIPFLNMNDPFAFTLEPNGSAGNWDRQATTKVTVRGMEPFQELQYQWSTESASPPLSDEWISFANRGEISTTAEGRWYLHIYVKDKDGTEKYARSNPFQVDRTPPTLQVRMTVGEHDEEYMNGAWANQQVIASLQAIDANMHKLQINIKHPDKSVEQIILEEIDEYRFERTFQDNGVYQLEIIAVDLAGNETKENWTIRISQEGLRMETALEHSDGASYISGNWTNQSVTANVYAYHTHEVTVTSSVYSLDQGESWQPFGDSQIQLDFSEEGNHSLWLKAQDEAGNMVEDKFDIKIDKTAPLIQLNPNGNDSTVPQEEVSTMVIVTDVGSGIDPSSLEYVWSPIQTGLEDEQQVDWQSFQSGDRLSLSGKTGTWYLHSRALDMAGNHSYTISEPFHLSGRTGGSSGSGGGGDRLLSSKANLKTLEVWAEGKRVSLAPSFKADTLSYTAKTEAKQIEVKAFAEHSAAKVTWQGETIRDSIQIDLLEGKNVITLVVRAEDDSRQTYTLTMERTRPEQGKVEPETPVISFTDIAGHWAEHEIKQAAAKDLVNGYPDGTFKPNNPVTRAEFTLMLINALQLEGTNTALTFTDAPQIGAWAQQAIAQSVQLGIVAGYEDGSFRPDAPITRAEMAVMIARALQLPTVSGAPTGFADDDEIPLWAKAAVEAIRELGIVNGRGGNHFVANNTATRAEMAVMLLRIVEQQLGFN